MALNPNDFTVSLLPNPLKVVLGTTGTASMHFSNNSTSERGYNLSVTMIIPDGASFVSSSVIPTSIITNPDNTITLSWINIKDLAPNEVNYRLDVTLQADDEFRSTGFHVPFDVPLVPFNMSGTVDTLPLGSDDPSTKITKTATATFIPARYNLIKQAPGKIPRGAGKISPVNEEPMWPYPYQLTLINNTRVPSAVTLFDALPNGVRYLNKLSVTGLNKATLSDPTVVIPSPSTGCLDYVTIDWGSVTLSAGSVNVITFTAAVWDKFTVGCEEDSGMIIPHGTKLTNSATLNGASGPIQSNSTTTALDALITKSNTPLVTDVGTTNHYTLTYEINQYANEENIIITDIIGEGQSYNNDSTPLSPQQVTVNPDGTTTLIWNLGLLPTGTTGTILFTTTVEAYYAPLKPVSAADTIVNGVKIDGINQTTTQLTPDTSGTISTIPIPTITKELLHYYYQDGTTQKDYSVAAPGDQVEFRITYSSMNINAEQLNIEIDEYAPANMGPLTTALPVTYAGTLGYTFTPLMVSPNGLRWNLGTVPGKSLWTATFKIPVADQVFDGQRNNLAKLAGRDTLNFSYSDRSQVEVTFGQPNITFAKTVSGPDPSAIKAGEIYTYSITISNPQNADLTVTDAFLMNLTDTIPADLLYTGTYNVSGSGSFTTPQFSGPNVSMTITKLAPGASLIFTYDVLVTSLVVSGQTYTNHAVLQAPHSQPSPTSFTYPGGPYTAQAVLKAKGLIVTKLVSPSLAKIGDIVNYTIQITVPLGTTAYNILSTDTFPAGSQTYIIDSLTKDGYPITPFNTQPGLISFPPIPFINAVAASVTIIYGFSVRITNGIHASPYSDLQTDNITTRWDLDNFGTPAIPVKTSAILDVQTPNLTITKEQRKISAPTFTTNNLPYVIGDIIQYRITVRNDGRAPAYNTKITDTINALLAYNLGSIITTLGSASVTATLLSWNIEQLDPLQNATLIFNVTSLPGAPADGRIPNQAVITRYNTNDNGFGIQYDPVTSLSINLIPPAVTIKKSASLAQGKIGDEITYSITVTVPAGTIAYSLIITDTLPLGKQEYIGPAMLQELPNPATEVFPDVNVNIITFPDPTIYASNGARTFIYSFIARIITGTHNPPNFTETQTDVGKVQWTIAPGGATRTRTADKNILVTTPNITLQKEQSTNGSDFTNDPITRSAGNTVYYRLTVNSNGAAPAFSINVSDILENNLTFGSIIYQQAGDIITPPPGPGGTLIWNISQLNNGSSAQLIFTVTVNTGVGASASILNAITATYASNDPAHHPVTYTASALPVTVNIPALLFSKSVNYPTASVGDTLTYTLTVTIPPGEMAYNLVIQDQIPDGQQYVPNSWTPTSPIPNTTTNTILWTDDLPSRLGPLTLTYQFQTTIIDGLFIEPYRVTQRNQAYTEWKITPSGPTATGISRFADVDVRVPHIITKKLQRNVTAGMMDFTPDPIPGVQTSDIIEFMLILTNDGINTAYNVNTTDPLDNLLSFKAFIPPLPHGTLTHFGGTSDGSVNWTDLVLAPGQSQTLIFSVQVLGGSPPGTTVTNLATTGYNTTAIGGKTLTAISNTTGFEFSLPVITKTVNKATVVLFDMVTYTIRVTIPNGNIAYNVQITDSLPPHQTYVPGSITLNNFPQPSSPTLNFDPLGTIDATEGAVTNIYTFQATIGAVTPPLKSQINTSTVNWAVNSSGTPGTPQSSSAAVYATWQTVQLSKSQRNTASPGSPFVTTSIPTAVGDLIEYQFTVTNPTSDLLYNVTVTDQLDPLLQFSSIVSPPPPNSGIIFPSNGTVIWNVPTLPPNTTYTTIIAVTVHPGGSAQGKIFNHLFAKYGVNTDPDVLFGPVLTTPIALDLPSLELLKSVDQSPVTLGTIITYTITLTVPNGTKAYNVILTDTLPPEQTYIGFATRNTIDVTPLQHGQVITFKEQDPIDATAGTVVITYSFQVRPVTGNSSSPYFMSQTNNVTATWKLSEGGAPAIPIFTDANLTVTNPEITLTKSQRNVTQGSGFTQDTIYVDVGDTVRFKLEATSIGASTAYRVRVFDTLDIHQTYLGVNSSTSGTATYDTVTKLLTWTIPAIPVNQTIPETLTFDVLILGGLPADSTTTNSALAVFTTNNTTPITLGPSTANPVTLRYPNIAINKLVNASNVAVGTTIIYTITITIPLGTLAYNLQVTDILAIGQSYVGPATLNGSTVIPIVNNQLITFPLIPFATATTEAKTFTYLFPVLVDSAVIDPLTFTEQQINSAKASWSYDGINPSLPVDSTVSLNVTDSSLNIIKQQRNLTVGGDFTTSELFASPGNIIEYSLTVTNTGPRTIYQIIITDHLDSALTYVDKVLVPVGEITFANDTVTWNIEALTANSNPVTAIFKVIYLQNSPTVPAPEIVLSNQALGTFQLTEQAGLIFQAPDSNIILLSSWIGPCRECLSIINSQKYRLNFGLDTPPKNPIPDCICHDICAEEVRFIGIPPVPVQACIAFPPINVCRVRCMQSPILTPGELCPLFIIGVDETITSHCSNIQVKIDLLIICNSSTGTIPLITTITVDFPFNSFVPFADCTHLLTLAEFQEALKNTDGFCTVIQLIAAVNSAGNQININGKVINKLWKHTNLWVTGLRPYDLSATDMTINNYTSYTISHPLQPI